MESESHSRPHPLWEQFYLHQLQQLGAFWLQALTSLDLQQWLHQLQGWQKAHTEPLCRQDSTPNPNEHTTHASTNFHCHSFGLVDILTVTVSCYCEVFIASDTIAKDIQSAGTGSNTVSFNKLSWRHKPSQLLMHCWRKAATCTTQRVSFHAVCPHIKVMSTLHLHGQTSRSGQTATSLHQTLNCSAS